MHAKQRESVCKCWECLFVGKPRLELLADRVLLLLLLFLLRPRNFAGMRMFCFLNIGQFSTYRRNWPDFSENKMRTGEI